MFTVKEVLDFPIRTWDFHFEFYQLAKYGLAQGVDQVVSGSEGLVPNE